MNVVAKEKITRMISLIIAHLLGYSSLRSSDEGEGGSVRSRQCAVQAVRPESSGSEEDVFERGMESELMGLMKTTVSPDMLVAAASLHKRGQGIERCIDIVLKNPCRYMYVHV